MRIVIQRVRKASVAVDGREVAEIGRGLVALIGFSAEEDASAFQQMARRLIELRIFSEKEGRLDLSLQDIQGELLLIPQITLTASLTKSTRPSFSYRSNTRCREKPFRQLPKGLPGYLPTNLCRHISGKHASNSSK